MPTIVDNEDEGSVDLHLNSLLLLIGAPEVEDTGSHGNSFGALLIDLDLGLVEDVGYSERMFGDEREVCLVRVEHAPDSIFSESRDKF